MSIAASEGESDFSWDDALVQLPPLGMVAVPDTDPEMMAMNWFLGVALAGSQPPTLVPFFLEVHGELTGTWKAPFTARNRATGPSSLTTLDGGVAKGYTRIRPCGAVRCYATVP